MAEGSSSKRSRKTVDYAAIEKGCFSSDDDFSPVYSSCESKNDSNNKKSDSKSNKESTVVTSRNDKPLTKRMSREEKLFQRDLEAALELSKDSTAEKSPIANSNKDEKEKNQPKLESGLSTFSTVVEVHTPKYTPKKSDGISINSTNDRNSKKRKVRVIDSSDDDDFDSIKIINNSLKRNVSKTKHLQTSSKESPQSVPKNDKPQVSTSKDVKKETLDCKNTKPAVSSEEKSCPTSHKITQEKCDIDKNDSRKPQKCTKITPVLGERKSSRSRKTTTYTNIETDDEWAEETDVDEDFDGFEEEKKKKKMEVLTEKENNIKILSTAAILTSGSSEAKSNVTVAKEIPDDKGTKELTNIEGSVKKTVQKINITSASPNPDTSSPVKKLISIKSIPPTKQISQTDKPCSPKVLSARNSFKSPVLFSPSLNKVTSSPGLQGNSFGKLRIGLSRKVGKSLHPNISK